MKTMLLATLWNNFSNWVTEEWSQTTFILVVTILGVLGLWALLTFFKGSINKDKKPKWGTLVVSIVMFVLLAILCSAKFI